MQWHRELSVRLINSGKYWDVLEIFKYQIALNFKEPQVPRNYYDKKYFYTVLPSRAIVHDAQITIPQGLNVAPPHTHLT